LDGFQDEPEPRAMVLSRPFVVESDKDVLLESKSEFFDKLIPMKSDINLRDQVQCETKEAQIYKSYEDEVWVEDAKFVAHDAESSDNSIQEARKQARLALEKAREPEVPNKYHIITWTAWGCDDQQTRRHIICFLTLLFLFVIVFALLISVLLSSNQEQVFSAANRPLNYTEMDDSLWIGDLPENKPFEEPLNLKTRPTRAPVVDSSTLPNSHQALTHETLLPEISPSTPSPPPKVDLADRLAPTEVREVSTSNPTEMVDESSASTNEPPSTCQSSLTSDKLCYIEDEDVIVVDFINCRPRSVDWVGIWRDAEDPSNLSQDFYAWTRSCGSKSCRGAPTSMQLAFEASGLGLDTFRAFLVHNTTDGTPYIVKAMSEPFVVTRDCSR